MESKRRTSIFIDGKEYATLADVPPELRARVSEQAQGIDAAKPTVPVTRRSVRFSGRTSSGGPGSSGASFLILAAVGVAGLLLLLYIIGR